jgi:hypothetical protein
MSALLYGEADANEHVVRSKICPVSLSIMALVMLEKTCSLAVLLASPWRRTSTLGRFIIRLVYERFAASRGIDFLCCLETE